jgi:hypothetical protein
MNVCVTTADIRDLWPHWQITKHILHGVINELTYLYRNSVIKFCSDSRKASYVAQYSVIPIPSHTH